MNRSQFFLPLAIFAVIVVVGYAGFHLGDRKILPSPLIGKPFPEFSAPTLRNPSQIVSRESLKGRPVLVNVWATWCPTCKAEHEMLLRIGREHGLEIVGVNYRDDPAAALRWLERYGDPYSFNIVDPEGALAVELGVYGAPESFLLNHQAEIVYKRVGDVNPRIWRDELGPALQLLEGVASAQ